MKILAIETSCDETAIASLKCSGGLKRPRFKILKNVVSSQIEVHRPFHGVVPNLAKREHIKNLPIVLKKVLGKTKLDYIAVTVGPGLEPALWTGINFAEELAKKLKKPLVGVNHLEGHIYSLLLPSKNSKHEARNSKQIQNSNILNSKHFGFRYSNFGFPAILLLVSGGHTILLNMKSITRWDKLGETLDDAAGEAFDKVARMLKLPYPGGPEIQKLAAKGNPKAINFPRPMLKTLSSSKGHRYEFSFSGLKTSVLYYLRDNPKARRADVAASFQQAVIDVLVKKTIRAAESPPTGGKTKSIMLCGGVAANCALREELKVQSEKLKVKFFVPDFEFNTDNAAMTAAAAYINLLKMKKSPTKKNLVGDKAQSLKLEAQGNLSI